MRDVALRAGVTKQTVSNVISGRVPVTPHTTERVHEAIDFLGYRPNLLARSLATGTSRTIGLLVPHAAHSFYAEMIEEVEDALNDRDHHLLLCTTRYDSERAQRQVDHLTSRLVDGLVVAGDVGLADQLASLRNLRTPIVLCAWESEPSGGLPVITTDYRKAGQLAGEHLRALGHTSVAVLHRHPTHDDRAEGFQLGFAGDSESQREGRRVQLVPVGVTEPPADTIAAVLAQPERPTAIFASHDVIALEMLHLARKAGLRVPEDLAIIGIDDAPETAWTDPQLSTVALPRRAMARAAVAAVLALFDGQEVSPSAPMEPTLVVRESTAGR